MTEPTDNDNAKSAAEEALQQQPVANPDADAEADQDDTPGRPTNLFAVDDTSPSDGPAI